MPGSFRASGSSRSGRLGALLVVFFLSGCAIKRPTYDVPPVPVPAHFKQLADPVLPQVPRERSEGERPAAGGLMQAQLAEWWRGLSSTELNALVDRAIANNADLRIASLRIAQAKARADQAAADELPVLTLPYRALQESPRGGVASVHEGGTPESRRVYQLGLRADWRVDLWGERQALTESAELQLARAAYQRDDVRRVLIASTASLYVEYLSLNDRIRVARETESVLSDMLESVRVRTEIGDATITDLEQQRAAVFSVQATIPGLELQRENVANSLATLVGATPSVLGLTERGLDSLNFPEALPGIPAHLVLQRPDVRAVESRLRASDADIDVARARLLPALDLSAQLGYGSLVFSRLFDSHNLFWNLIANLTATLFDYGKRSNEVVLARALHEEMVETYIRVLYTAIREVDDAIAAIDLNGRRLEAQRRATDAAQRAWELSSESYQAGAIDYLTLLDTQRTYHRNLDELHRINMERHKGLVALFGALGGGVPDDLPPVDGVPLPVGPAPLANAPSASPGQSYAPAPDYEHWVVEIAGVQDRAGVAHLWRDLNARFPEQMAGRRLLSRLQGQIASERQMRASWYRVFVSHFDTLAEANVFCSRLMSQLQRCRTLSSAELADPSRVPQENAGSRSLLQPAADSGTNLVELVTKTTGEPSGMPATLATGMAATQIDGRASTSGEY
ncbi:efflux transporter outer membrane subunit [Thauera aromatica]|uniref:efflux transporter outer membrane subunit n=1 Tax=Thauera aromatica TaxID=59405 RepID=UPI001FFCCF99|nr:efflux transporter outer membrane subunit [Thauera aromatica]